MHVAVAVLAGGCVLMSLLTAAFTVFFVTADNCVQVGGLLTFKDLNISHSSIRKQICCMC